MEAWTLSRTVLYDAQYSENVVPSLKHTRNPSADFSVNFVHASVAYLLTRDEHSFLSSQVLGR